jgi:hypothetical protein
MPAATTTSIWVVLLPVIVGGVIGVFGGIVGPPFVHYLQQRAEKKKKRAEKYEELVLALYEHRHWLETVTAIRTLGREGTETVSPLPKAQAIASVYFPEFDERIKELDLMATKHELWTLEAGQKRLKNLPDFSLGQMETYGPYAEKLFSILSDLREFATREFQ